MKWRSRDAHRLTVNINQAAYKLPVRKIGLACESVNRNDRAAGKTCISQCINAFREGARANPLLNRGVDFVALCETIREALQRRVSRKIGPLHDFAQSQPLIVGRRADKDPAILCLIAVPWCAHRMAVASAFWRLA